MQTMELQTWSGDFGLPTWDQKCLCAATYAKFCGAPVTLCPVDDPLSSLPILADRGPPTPGVSRPVGSLAELCKLLSQGQGIEIVGHQGRSARWILSAGI